VDWLEEAAPKGVKLQLPSWRLIQPFRATCRKVLRTPQCCVGEPKQGARDGPRA